VLFRSERASGSRSKRR